MPSIYSTFDLDHELSPNAVFGWAARRGSPTDVLYALTRLKGFKKDQALLDACAHTGGFHGDGVGARVVPILIEIGADVNYFGLSGHSYITPLAAALMARHDAVLMPLLNAKARIHKHGWRDQTPAQILKDISAREGYIFPEDVLAFFKAHTPVPTGAIQITG